MTTKTKTVKSNVRFLKEYALILFVILLSIICGIVNKSFFTGSNIQNVLRTTSNLAVISMGMLLVVVTGGIDLCVAANAGFAGVFLAGVLQNGMGAFPRNGQLRLLPV